jgi:hypothetical protein
MDAKSGSSTVLHLVRLDDLQHWLEDAERWECGHCGRVIQGRGYGGFVVREGAPLPFCDRPECIANARDLVGADHA